MTWSPRHAPRQQLILKIEFDHAAGFRSNYLTDLPQGGVRLPTKMETGQRLLLHISLAGSANLLQVEAIVRWSLPRTHPDGPASGLAFAAPSPEARAWLRDVLGASRPTIIPPEPSCRVLLLETQPFLRDIYGQEVRNWAELRDEAALDLVASGDLAGWFEEVTRAPATLGIVDVDELPTPALDLYKRVRADARSALLPLIMIGSPGDIAAFSAVSDKLLCCLCKPLRFGLLMNTVGKLARDPLPASSRPSSRG